MTPTNFPAAGAPPGICSILAVGGGDIGGGDMSGFSCEAAAIAAACWSNWGGGLVVAGRVMERGAENPPFACVGGGG
jgi:hypothetical protein